MDGNRSPESPRPHKNIFKKIVDHLKPPTQNFSRPTLEDQLKTSGMPYGSYQDRPTTRQQVKIHKVQQLIESTNQVREVLEELNNPPGGWHDFEKEAYDKAMVEGRTEEAEAYRKMIEARIAGKTEEYDTYQGQVWELSQKRLKNNQPKRPLREKIANIFKRK